MNRIISPPFLAKLDPERQKVFEKLKAFQKNFTLSGGTALMLQIGHRLSYDFDLFSDSQLPINLFRTARQACGRETSLQLTTEDILQVKTPQGVDVHFVYYPYKPLREAITSNSLSLSHLDDLAANKAYTLGRRPVWRDYVDLFFLLKGRLYDIPKMIVLSEKKFSGEFNSKLFLEQLVYFEDVKVVPITFLKEDYQEDQIKSFLEKQVEMYLRKILP